MSSKPVSAKYAVTSRDGTRIGYRQLGDGPGVVLQHGGALASQHYMRLAGALAGEFTVYLPDRRGRGMSGPYGPHYCIEREDEDLEAIIAATGAQNVFGAADGGLFALHASMVIPAIRKVALFEPVLFVGQPGLDEFKATIDRGQRLVDSGDLPAAMASLAKDAAHGDPRAQRVPGPLRLLGKIMTRPMMCRVLLWADARRVTGDDAALRDLIVAWKEELNVVKATEGHLDDFAERDRGRLADVRHQRPGTIHRHTRRPGQRAAPIVACRTTRPQPRRSSGPRRQSRGHRRPTTALLRCLGTPRRQTYTKRRLGYCTSASSECSATEGAIMTGTSTAGRPSTGRFRIPRSRGALMGVVLVLLGSWGVLIPFFGQQFGLSYAGAGQWEWTAARGWLQVVPGFVTIVGGIVLIQSRNRLAAVLGAWLSAFGRRVVHRGTRGGRTPWGQLCGCSFDDGYR